MKQQMCYENLVKTQNCLLHFPLFVQTFFYVNRSFICYEQSINLGDFVFQLCIISIRFVQEVNMLAPSEDIMKII